MTTNEVEIRSAFFIFRNQPTGGEIMYLEPNNPTLSFADFLEAAIRDKAEKKPFPYTLEVCRCRYCSYCKNGKCALNRCCINERVKARSCTFAELLRDCFYNFKDNVSYMHL